MATKNYATKTTGNASARPGKREAFKASKGERANLADSILTAYTKRTDPPYKTTKLESVEGDVKPVRFKK